MTGWTVVKEISTVFLSNCIIDIFLHFVPVSVGHSSADLLKLLEGT
jgi:hypothetical protein